MQNKNHYQYVLITGLLFIFLIIIAAVTVSLQRMLMIEENLKEVVNEHMNHAVLVEQMVFHARERSLLLYQIVTTEDAFVKNDLYEEFLFHGGQFIKVRSEILESNPVREEMLIIRRQGVLTSEVVPLQYKVIELSNIGLQDDAKHLLFSRVIPEQNKIIALLRQFTNMQEIHTRHALEATSDSYQETVSIAIWVVALILSASVFITVFMIRRVSMVNAYLTQRDEEVSIANSVLRMNIDELYEKAVRLVKSEKMERAIRENMLDSVVAINDRGIIESCNPATEKIFGYSADEMLGKNVSMLMPESIASNHDAYVERIAAAENNPDTVIGKSRDQMGRRKDGSIFPLDIGITKVHIDNRLMVVGIMRDVTERKLAEEAMERSRQELEQLVEERTYELKEANEKLHKLASYDYLTSLPNRMLIYDFIKHEMARARRNQKLLALLFLDLDGFKRINDAHGHDVGDILLQQVAARLKQCVREEDAVARIGGDEFLVVLGDLTEKINVDNLAQRLINEMRQPFDLEGIEAVIGVSIGVSFYPSDGDTIEGLFKLADDAMYQVKRSGKNNYAFVSRQKAS